MLQVLNSKMMYELKKAEEGDLKFLLALRRATMDEYLLCEGMDVSDKQHILRINFKFEDAKIVTVKQQKVGLFKASFLIEKSQWYIHQVQILPQYQGMGIGRGLITELCRQASKNKHAVGLSVLKCNPAKALYENLGFKVTGINGSEYEMVYGA